MKFKHTVDLIYFLREIYDLYEREGSIYHYKNLIGVRDIGTGEYVKIDDTIDGDNIDDVYSNLCFRGRSKYVSMATSCARFPLVEDEIKDFYNIFDAILSAVKNDIDDKELCDSMIEYVKSTKFYREKYGNDL